MDQDFEVQDSNENEPGAMIATGIRPAIHSYPFMYEWIPASARFRMLQPLDPSLAFGDF